MKKILASIALLILAISSFGQFKIVDDPALKKGIYRTFEEFKNNSPSLPLDFQVKTYKITSNDANSVAYLSFYNLHVKKKAGKAIGEVFGFCDGANVYINSYIPVLHPKASFYKIIYWGQYCYFENYSKTYSGMTGYGGGVTIRIHGNIIDLSNGRVTEFDKDNFREFIADDEELLARYNDEKLKKHKKIKDYFFEYMDRKNKKK